MELVFPCKRCRVWTGDAAQPPCASIAADESELDSVDGIVDVAWEPSRREIQLVHETRAWGDHRRRLKRRLTIREDDIRTIAVYCASPFSTTVIVQVDVGGSIQQCFLFSRVSTALQQPTGQHEIEKSANDWQVLREDDRDQMLDFLAALHSHLNYVPLTAQAREMLDTQRIKDSATFAKRISLKRRRTISPSDFYGRVSSEQKLPNMAAVAAEEDTVAWSAFYQRLQYNVSHSLLCQLEGAAPLSASFPRQQEAFEFVDQVVAFRQRLGRQQRVPSIKSLETSTDRLTNPVLHLDLDEPRVFCFEGANLGKRRFWVTTLAAFWKEYTQIPDGARHVYEIIREGVPCRLYFDLEFKKRLNPGIDGDALVERLISLVQLQIYRLYRLRIDRGHHVVQLESSTDEKFSRHLTIHFPNHELFVDNIHAGAFVRLLIHDLVATADGDSLFLVHDSTTDASQRHVFIDVGVYTRNRMFRVLGSSKYGKTAVLRSIVEADNTGSTTSDSSSSRRILNRDLFMRSIVCPRSTLPAPATLTRLLRCDDAMSFKRYGQSSGFSFSGGSGAMNQAMRSVEARSSIFPMLDAFIRSVATTGGVQGEIRAVHLLYTDTPEDDRPVHVAAAGGPAKIVYHMMRNRFCERIGRAHKSNNVMFVVDVAWREYTQRCHDPQCQALDYRSAARPLPADVALVSKCETNTDTGPP